VRKLSISILSAIISVAAYTVFSALPAFAATSYRQFGTSGSDQVNVSTSDGTGVYVAGATTGAFPGFTNAGGQDAFVRKFDFQGNELWTRQFGTTGTDQPQAITFDASGIYIGGGMGTNSDAFVRKYDQNGNELWTKNYNFGGNNYTYGIAVDSQNMYLSFMTEGAIPGHTNAGNYDVVVQKADLDGNEVWSRQTGSSQGDFTPSLTLRDGNIYIAGFTNEAFPGQTLLGWKDAFILKYENDGTLAWTRQFGTTENDFVNALTTDSTGVYTTGTTEGTMPGQTNTGGFDGFIQKFDFDGDTIWTRQFGDSNYDDMRTSVVHGSNIYTVGSSGTEFLDAVTTIHDINGNSVKTDHYSSTQGALSYGVAVVGDTVYNSGLVGGTFPGQTSGGEGDAFLIVESSHDKMLTNLAPAKAWLSRGLLDLGLRADIKAEVFLNGTLLSTGQVNSSTVGSGIFGTPASINIPFAAFAPTAVPDGATLGVKLSARNACSNSLRNNGTVRLWYGNMQFDSQFGATIDTAQQAYYLHNGAALATSPGSGTGQQGIIQAGARCSNFKTFGTWATTL
jgi:hypothetical protein